MQLYFQIIFFKSANNFPSSFLRICSIQKLSKFYNIFENQNQAQNYATLFSKFEVEIFEN